MLAITRKNEIKNRLLQHKSVSVIELSTIFNVAEETIRRDLKTLELEGVAERTHGGAILSQKVSSSFGNHSLKSMLKENKHAMAKLAIPYIKSGYCIFLDASTTTQHIVKELHHLLNLVVVTNSLDVIISCSSNENINLISLGGKLNHKDFAFSGIPTFNELKNYYFDITIISCRTLHMENGLTDSDTEAARLKLLAISQSRCVILLADHTKFDKMSFVKICDFSKIDILITDKPLSEDWMKMLSNQSVEVRVAQIKN